MSSWETEALRGQFDEHHAFMLRMLLDTIDHLSVQVDRLTAPITTKFAQMAEASGLEVDGASEAGGDDTPGKGLLLSLTDIERLDETPGGGPTTAQVILAEIGPDRTRRCTSRRTIARSERRWWSGHNARRPGRRSRPAWPSTR
ncbi:hypothetical protein [Streptomyces sp. NPDC058424]|uniref:hypothetical protein n=1 Tax=Streptomyces sp. NPDC058424 TaxID=3346491 RepID=UPI00365AD008